MVELVGDLFGVRGAVAGERGDGVFGAEHVEHALVERGVGGLELGERQLGERHAALHRGGDQLADQLVGGALRHALHDEVFHQRGGVEVAAVEPGGDRVAVVARRRPPAARPARARPARCATASKSGSLSSCRSRL